MRESRFSFGDSQCGCYEVATVAQGGHDLSSVFGIGFLPDGNVTLSRK